MFHRWLAPWVVMISRRRLQAREQAADMIDAMIEVVGLTEDELDSNLREAGVDPGSGKKRQSAQTRDPSWPASSGALRAEIEGWIQHLVQTTLSDRTGSLMIAAARAGSSTAERAGSEGLVEDQWKAIELLAAGRYAEAHGFLVGLLRKDEEPQALRWCLVHALLGLGEMDEAKQLLATIGPDLQPIALERLQRIEQLLGS